MLKDNTGSLSFEDFFSDWSVPVAVSSVSIPTGRLMTASEQTAVALSVPEEADFSRQGTGTPEPVRKDDGGTKKGNEAERAGTGNTDRLADISTKTERKKQKNKDICRGKEIVEELYARPEKDRETKLHMEMMGILHRQLLTAIAISKLDLQHIKIEDLESEILMEIDSHIKGNHKKRLPFGFSYIVMVAQRHIFKRQADRYNLSESQYYHIILVNRISELYNLPLDKYYAYKFTRLINHHYPKVGLTNTKVLRAIEIASRRNISVSYDDMENWIGIEDGEY